MWWRGKVLPEIRKEKIMYNLDAHEPVPPQSPHLWACWITQERLEKKPTDSSVSLNPRISGSGSKKRKRNKIMSPFSAATLPYPVCGSFLWTVDSAMTFQAVAKCWSIPLCVIAAINRYEDFDGRGVRGLNSLTWLSQGDQVLIPCPLSASKKSFTGSSSQADDILVSVQEFPRINFYACRARGPAFSRRERLFRVCLSDIRSVSVSSDQNGILKPETRFNPDSLPNLPNDCIICIFAFFNPKDLGVISCICRSWRRFFILFVS